MIGYLTVGTNDLPRATAFYDKLFEAIGGTRLMEQPRGIIWSFGPTCAAFGVMTPYDGKPATIGNGSMVGLSMNSKARVNEMHRLALSLGATDEGAPGQRDDMFYASYFRDLDGNKICLFFMA